MINIAFVHNTLDIGGIEKALINLLHRLDYNKFNVDLYILSARNTLQKEIDSRVRIIYHNNTCTKGLAVLDRIARHNNSRVMSILLIIMKYTITRIFRYKLIRSKVFPVASKEEYDVVVSLNQGYVQEFALFFLNSGRRVAYFHHGDVAEFSLFKQNFSRFDRIAVVSSGIADIVKSSFPDLADKVGVVHNIVPVDEIRDKSRECIRLPVERYLIVSCGRLSYEKGFDMAVVAAKTLVEEGFTDFKWIIVGDGPERGALQEMIERYSLGSNISLIGWKRNPYPYFRQCQLYVQPSRVESYGISIVEAQIIGKAIVATRTVGASEVITDKVTGLLCEVSANAIASAIKQLLSSQELLVQISHGVQNIDFSTGNRESLASFYKIISG